MESDKYIRTWTDTYFLANRWRDQVIDFIQWSVQGFEYKTSEFRVKWHESLERNDKLVCPSYSTLRSEEFWEWRCTSSLNRFQDRHEKTCHSLFRAWNRVRHLTQFQVRAPECVAPAWEFLVRERRICSFLTSLTSLLELSLCVMSGRFC